MPRPDHPQPSDHDIVMEWLIRYDRLPPGCQPPAPGLSQVVASVILALLGYGVYRLITG